MAIALVLFFGVVVLLWIFNKFSRPKNYPPGPFLFPIVGALPQLGIGGFQESLTKWRTQYGNIFSFNVGPLSMVVLNDYNLIKEAYAMEEFTGRPFNAQLREIAGDGRRGLLASEGVQWEAQRRFALRHLRDFGFGKRSMESATQEDIVDLIAKFKKEAGQPISTALRFNQSVISALWQIITGQKYDLDDPEFGTVIKKLKAATSTNRGIGPALMAVPWLVKMAPNVVGWTKFKDAVDTAKAFMEQQIHEHKETYQEGNFRDFIDVYINEMNQAKDSTSSFFGTAGFENLRTSSLNLFAAGSETTSSTLTWALLYLSRNQAIQKRFQAEIDAVIGRSRLPSLSDQESLPYVAATIMEVMRKSALVPLGVPHSTMSEVKFHGFAIPKNTTIVANLYDLHNDKKIWGDPEVFRPERFLTPDGKSLVKGHPPLIPFGIGKRQCLGETLARNNIFLFLVSIFQTFDIKPHQMTLEEPKVPGGIARFAPEFKVIFEERR